MKFKNILLSACAALVMFSQPGFSKEIKIGMAIDDLRLERWQKDRDIFVNKAESLGAKVLFNRPMAMKKHKWRRLKI